MSISNNPIPRAAIGLDIGTTKICAIVLVETDVADQYKIVGFSSVPSTGMHRGVISNIKKTTDAIQKVITDVQQKTGIQTSEVMVGIAGDHIEAQSSSATTIITGLNQIVAESDVERLTEDLLRSKISSDREIILIAPYEYILDEQGGVIQPVGMCCTRLHAKVHLVTGLKTAIKNIRLCIESIPDLILKSIILEPVASSLALLSTDEKEVGVCLIDIGGGTTDISIFKDDVLRFTSEVAMGGNNITEDIRDEFKITKAEAERIKCENGHTYIPALLKQNQKIMIKSVSGASPIETTSEVLCGLIQTRMEEILTSCYKEIKKSGLFESLSGVGIVITGGTAQLNGLVDLARRIFQLPVRIGYPTRDKYIGLSTEIESPIYSTAVGLALHSLNHVEQKALHYMKEDMTRTQPIEKTLTPDESNTQEDTVADNIDTTAPSLMKKIEKFFKQL